MKHFSYLNSAAAIIENYNGSQPFHLFIKDFFRQYKKYGSKDRKQISHLCYCYYRLGEYARNKPVQQCICEALFLCSGTPNELLEAINPAWNNQVLLTIEEKCALLQIPPGSLNIFPSTGQLSNDIDIAAFNISHLVQPDTFIRIRPGQLQTVTDKLTQAKVYFKVLNPQCIQLPAATKLDELLHLNKEAVIQDYSSQQTGLLMELVAAAGAVHNVWDCCAASGGKSILAKDTLGNFHLTVSDIRPAILANLAKRFREANITNYNSLQADLTKPFTKNLPQNADLIIADAPCTGSGTWGRTPERLTWFDEKEIDSYSRLQQKIVSAVLPSLKQGGYFLYITCSVFKKENEDLAAFIMQNPGMQLIQKEILKGYPLKADTMFAALFKRR